MRLVLVGPPGSGKGTQAKLLVERLALRYIGTGDMLRNAIRHKTPTGVKAQPFMDAGQLVPDDMVNQVVAEVFQNPDKPERFVLDGYPRTVAQAIWFDGFMKEHNQGVNGVIQFAISDEEVVRRLSGRRICPTCGTVYHIMDRPPKKADHCDRDDAVLVQRPDDREDTIRARLKVFHNSADQLVAYYRTAGLLCEIPTNAPIESIYETILRRIGAK